MLYTKNMKGLNEISDDIIENIQISCCSQIDEIDRIADIDSGHFWRLIIAYRKTSNSSPGTELIFNGQTFSSLVRSLFPKETLLRTYLTSLQLVTGTVWRR